MPSRSFVSWNTLIGLLTHNGEESEDATCVCKSMPERSVVTWSSMAAGSVQNELYEEALALFQTARETGSKQDEAETETEHDLHQVGECRKQELLRFSLKSRRHHNFALSGTLQNPFVLSFQVKFGRRWVVFVPRL
ncbi:Pentatricopeptide repeat-containing protein, mitochondrial, partial [Cucurbita argyrosperma subsp. sororia]